MKTLIDQFGRTHDYLRLSLTDKCNLRCSYCMPEERIKFKANENLMQADEIFKITRVFVNYGVKKLKLTGGEPLIRSDFSEIAISLSNLPVEMGITTNGIFLHDYLDTLKKTRINSINISLDTLKEHKFSKLTRRNAFQSVMDNISLAEKEGFKLKINSVLLKNFNDDEIHDFIELTRNHSIDVRFIEYMPFNGNRWEYEKVVSYESILNQLSKAHEFEAMQNKDNSTSRNFKLKGAKGSFGIISSITKPFCESCNRIRLTADGKLKNCLFSTREADILQPFRSGEKIEGIIQDAIRAKHYSRGGLHNFEMEGAVEEYAQNRSMIFIGG